MYAYAFNGLCNLKMRVKKPLFNDAGAAFAEAAPVKTGAAAATELISCFFSHSFCDYKIN